MAEITPQEQETIATLPAAACNRLFVHASDAWIRLSFGEQFSGESIPNMRAAVVLSHADARELIKLLNEYTKPAPADSTNV